MSLTTQSKFVGEYYFCYFYVFLTYIEVCEQAWVIYRGVTCCGVACYFRGKRKNSMKIIRIWPKVNENQ